MRAALPHGLGPVHSTRQVTIGGAIANDIHGKNHHTRAVSATTSSRWITTADGSIRTLTRKVRSRTCSGPPSADRSRIIVRATIRMKRTETRIVVDADRTADLDETLSC